MQIRLFGTAPESVVDGRGIRYAVFVQGCNRNCKGCHNPNSHKIDGGYIADTDTLADEINNSPLADGVTFSGGEPFLQAEALCEIARKIKPKHIAVYSGYTFEELLEKPEWKKLLELSDVLVDGEFREEEKSYDLHFKGSKNQRVIDTKESLKLNKAVEIEW